MRNPGRGVKAAIAALAVTGVILAVSDAGAQQSSNEFPVGVDDTALRFKPSLFEVRAAWPTRAALSQHAILA